MENYSKKTIRSNKAQIKYLCQYMAQHPEFAAGEYRTPLGAASNNAEWSRLKETLDELGPQRTVDQWKICWRDQKRKARDEGGALNRAQNATGNAVPMPELSDNSELVLSAIGQEMAVGFGPAESPIGYSQETIEELRPPNPSMQAQQPSHSGISKQFSPLSQPVKCQRKKRTRQVLPPERFLTAQLELNNLIKDLIKEVRRGNDLKEAHLNLMNGADKK